ncbi:hypothetical protein KIH79_00620 [Bifidobacterium sp. 82T10]|uniref:Bacteriophage abortive infection AbiH n=1 Tax=Bifidobacterium miconis TaxID=2834435 RepID=A0ABS6WBQ6_9BIFI|nr:AbiH family protein [Bifidobacterium miconis]MBW3091478.1 hypothetical protein [Bifidobacterium miconis]
MAYTQIIVLGNGFDLAQQIPSSYPDFFLYRYREYRESDGSVPHLLQKLSDKPFGGICIWDYLFAFWHDSDKELKEWKDVETAIGEWVIGEGQISFADAIGYWKVTSTRDTSRQRDDWPADVQHVYTMVKNRLRYKVDFSVLADLADSTDKEEAQIKKKEEALVKFKESVLGIFASELHVIEDSFANYLDAVVKERPTYDDGCDVTYKNIAKAGGTEVPLEEQSNAILSFNYTVPMALVNDPSVYYIRNVHGDLPRREDEILSGYEYHVVFGIDGQSCMNQPGVYQFTKTARVLTLRRQHILDAMRNKTLFDAQNNGDGIAEVKVFGHSLGEADYSYFQSLFDLIDLYGGKTRLTFCGTGDYPVNPDAVIRLMTKYGETIVPEAHGKNLLHKLLLEDRLKIDEISPL